MNEGTTAATVSSNDDAPTAEQTALLRHFDLLPAEPLSQKEAGALIGQLEAAPDWQPHLEAWHRDKAQLHPDLFATTPPPAAPPQRSFREARWWQSQITDGSLYGYSFRQPSVNQALVILQSLDTQAPGWERETKKRRAHRFMNELATLSPELCKPGCSFPHELPADGDSSEDVPTFDSEPSAPSAPFVPSPYAATSAPLSAPSRPTWQPPVQPPVQEAASHSTPTPPRKGAGKWVLLLLLLAAGAGAYGYLGFRPSTPVRDDIPAPSPVKPGVANAPATKPANVLPTLPAKESQRRAMERYPDLAKAGTPLNRTFVALVHQLEVERSPRLQQPDWPERLADECATALVIAPVTRPNTPAPPAATPKPLAAPPLAVPPNPLTAASSSAAAPSTAFSTVSPPAPPPSANPASVSLNAAYKEKVNTVKYNQHGSSQEASVQVDVQSMAHGGSAKFVVRCVFFKRPNHRGDLRSVLSTSDKHFELTAGQKFTDSFESASVYRGRGATEEFDGWLVQLFPEGSDKFIKQLGSTGPIEELGKTMRF